MHPEWAQNWNKIKNTGQEAKWGCRQEKRGVTNGGGVWRTSHTKTTCDGRDGCVTNVTPQKHMPRTGQSLPRTGPLFYHFFLCFSSANQHESYCHHTLKLIPTKCDFNSSAVYWSNNSDWTNFAVSSNQISCSFT